MPSVHPDRTSRILSVEGPPSSLRTPLVASEIDGFAQRQQQRSAPPAEVAESDPQEEAQTVAPTAGGGAKEKAPRKAGFKDDAAIAKECAWFPVPPAGDCSNCRSNCAKGKCSMHRSVGNHKFANHERKDWKDHIKDKGIADEPLRLGQVTKVDATGKKKVEFYPTSFNNMVKYQVSKSFSTL